MMNQLRQAVCEHLALRVVLITGTSEQLGPWLDHYRVRAVKEGLLAGLNEEQSNRVVFVQRTDMVHSKTLLIGSVDMARRSFYTDIEQALAFEDPQEKLVREYRKALWQVRQGTRAEGIDPNDLERALKVWENDPGRRLARHELEEHESIPNGKIDREWYDMVDDPESRKPWYFPLRRSCLNFIRPENHT